MTKLEALVLEWQEARRQDYEALDPDAIKAAVVRVQRAAAALMAYKVPTS